MRTLFLFILICSYGGIKSNPPEEKYWGIVGAIPAGAEYYNIDTKQMTKSTLGHAFVGVGLHSFDQKMCKIEVFGNHPVEDKFTWITKIIPGYENTGSINNDFGPFISNKTGFLIFEIDKKKYQSIVKLRGKWENKKTWTLLQRDCVDFLSEAAQEFQFKLPEYRLFSLTPYSYFMELAKINKKEVSYNTVASGPQPTVAPALQPTAAPGPRPTMNNQGEPRESPGRDRDRAPISSEPRGPIQNRSEPSTKDKSTDMPKDKPKTPSEKPSVGKLPDWG